MWRDKLFFVFLVFYFSLDYAQPESVNEHPFDLLIFTQQWPQTVCKEWRQSNPSHKCSMPPNQDSWTIHGVWPTKLHTMGPAFCNRSWHFDPEAVKPIEGPLTILWTNIEGDPKYGLWSHEWSKHGTCAAVLEPLSSEFKYFNNGLNWMKQYNMLNILNEYNIVPSNDAQYPITAIHKAVVDKLHVNPAIECRKIEGKSWLVEIRICFNKTLHLADCDGVLKEERRAPYYSYRGTDILTNCNTNEDIFYPKDEVLEAPLKMYLVELYKAISWLQWFTL